MNDEELNLLLKKRQEERNHPQQNSVSISPALESKERLDAKGSNNKNEFILSHSVHSKSLQNSGVPDFSKTGILIRKIFTVLECHADGTVNIISSNSWIDKNGLPQKKKKQTKEIALSEIKQMESY